VRSVSPARRRHILFGDATGGGHLWPGASGKTPFPRDWSAERIITVIEDVAADPESTVKRGRGGRSIMTGTRDGVEIRVVVDAGGEIVTGFAVGLPRNPSGRRSGE